MIQKLLSHPMSRFRLIAILEGISFILLVGIGMPLKYYAGLPLFVKFFGWMHGVLFILYLLSIGEVTGKYKWKALKVLVAFVAGLLPFGTFILEARLRKEYQAKDLG